MFAGEYSSYYKHLGGSQTAVGFVLWELGAIGLIIILSFLFMILYDAHRLSQFGGLAGTIAHGWIAVLAISLVCLAYNNMIVHNVLGYSFFYFSGYISSQICRIVNSQRH